MARILIVDDSRTSRKVLRGILEAEGYTVIDEAVNGEEGVQKFREQNPDIVTLDITMPVMGGKEALKEIMAFQPDAKAVMITAAGQRANVEECFQNGARGFIAKPYDREEIIRIMEGLKG